MGAIDIDMLLTELSPDAPCGENLEYDAEYLAVFENAKGTPEQQIGNRVEAAVPPNWRDVVRESVELLQRTHDLRLALLLTEALIQANGWGGLHDGLTLTRGMLETFWDTVHPQLDPDDDLDPTQRVNILMGMCDFEAFIRPIHLLPLVQSRAVGRYSLRDIQIATGKLSPPADEESIQLAAVQAAFSDADIDELNATRSFISGSREHLTRIEAFVTDQVGVGNAPNFALLLTPLKEALQILDEHLARRGVEIGEGTEGEVRDEISSSTAAAGRMGAISSRQDVVRALDLICDYYARLEPSSPVPLFLQRAKRLVSKDFMDIIKDLAPDGLGQVQFIKGQDENDGY